MSMKENSQEPVLNNVKRLTQSPELKEKLEEIARSRKTAFVGARMTTEEYAMLEIIANQLKTNKSDAIRYLIRIGYGLLSGAPEIKVGKVIIQNPVVNMNINNVVAEAKPNVNVKVDLEPLARLVERLYELRKPLPPTQRKLVEELYHTIRKLN